MSHVDEGTLHAYLDGECSGAEVTELERHLAGCAQCRTALAEARGFLAQSDGLIVALDVAGPGRKASAPPSVPRRTRRLATLAWAASIVAAIGLGYTLRNTTTPTGTESPAIDEGGARLDRQAPSLQTRPSQATPPTHRPEVARRDAPASPAPTRAETKSSNAMDQASGAGVASTDAIAEARPTPQPAQTSPAPAAAGQAKTAAPSNLALVEGVPVDTSVAHRLFGPAHPPAPRRITMDEAVTHLGGTIRLIDGLTPQRVELLAGVDVPGADPGREVVRIYYEEPDLGLVTLDQQRPGPSFSAFRSQSEISADSVSVTGAPAPAQPNLSSLGRNAMASISWRSDGAWLSLTSRLSKDQMAMLQARVK